MATYAYQQNFANGGGYIQYNISPGYGLRLGVNDTVTVTGKIYCTAMAVRCVQLRGAAFGYINKSFAKGKAGTFTMAVTLTQSRVNAIFAGESPLVTTKDVLVHFGVTPEPDIDGGMLYTTTVSSQKVNVIRGRLVPQIDSLTFRDLHPAVSGSDTPLAYFGGYLQGRSLPCLDVEYHLDERDTKLTATHRLVVTDSSDAVVYDSEIPTTAMSGTVRFQLPAFAAAGQYTAVYTIRDSALMSSTDGDTLTVLAYTPPAISSWIVERYVIPVGETDPVPAPGGSQVMLTIAASVAAVASKNAWALTMRWGADGSQGTTVQLASDTDGAAIAYVRNTALLTTQVPASAGHFFELVLSDMLGQAVKTTLVMPGVCYLNVEKYGIGIGMYSGGATNDKRVEIADSYRLMPYGDVIIPENKLLKVLTVSDTVTVSTDSASQSKTIAVNPGTGWTAIGVVGFEASQSWCAVRQARLVNGSVEMAVRYHGSSSTGQTVTLTAAVLCLHTTLN